MMTMTLYHGSDEQFSELNPGSYATPDISTARGFGRLIYKFEGIPDEEVTFERNGRTFLSGEIRKGTTTQVQIQFEEKFLYVVTHKPHTVTLIETR